MKTSAFGDFGERLACQFLKKQGYQIIECNFRIRGGEIDIIALDKNTLVYVEVKTRSTHQYGYPEEAITVSKLRFLRKAAKFYRIARQNLPELERIDVVAVDLINNKKPYIRLIKNASF